MSLIKAWSYSRLAIYEQCPFRAKLAYIDRIPEPERPLPPGRVEHANDRGTRIHDAAERYVKDDIEMLPDISKYFKEEFIRLKALFKEGKVSLEGEWGFTDEWEPTQWMSSNVWARIKLDALVFLSDTEAVVIDYKTGRKFGNEIKHAEQCQLYQLATFFRYPNLQRIHTELWYLDQDDLSSMSYTREQGLRFYNNFHNRGTAITTADEFPSKPSTYACKWCPYSPRGSGDCPDGV